MPHNVTPAEKEPCKNASISKSRPMRLASGLTGRRRRRRPWWRTWRASSRTWAIASPPRQTAPAAAGPPGSASGSRSLGAPLGSRAARVGLGAPLRSAPPRSQHGRLAVASAAEIPAVPLSTLPVTVAPRGFFEYWKLLEGGGGSSRRWLPPVGDCFGAFFVAAIWISENPCIQREGGRNSIGMFRFGFARKREPFDEGQLVVPTTLIDFPLASNFF